jgi:hypothetical protein
MHVRFSILFRSVPVLFSLRPRSIPSDENEARPSLFLSLPSSLYSKIQCDA